jgi:hypothetical protein
METFFDDKDKACGLLPSQGTCFRAVLTSALLTGARENHRMFLSSETL